MVTTHSAEMPIVTVFGVGGAGGNAVARLLDRPDSGMKIVCANTDMQALRAVPPANRLQLGRRLTSGLGAGARPEVGRAAAEEALPAIRRALEGTSLCFIAAGMGGGTGSGAAPVIARVAREMGILTVGVATKPFAFEGKRRLATAEAALVDLRGAVDALVTVCNQKLFLVIGADTTLGAALALSDSIIRDSATDFALLLGEPALKNITLADLRALLASSGDAMIGYGERRGGRGRALEAARAALECPLLDGNGAHAERLLVTIAGGDDLGLFEIEEAMAWLRESVPAATDIAWGAVIDPTLAGRVRVGVVAGGLRQAPPAVAAVQPATPRPAPVVAAVQRVPRPPEPVVATAAASAAAPPFDSDRAVAPAALARGIAAVAHQPRHIVAEPVIATALARPAPLKIERIRTRTARPSLADRLIDAARDLTRRPALDVPQPTPRAQPVFHITKPFAPTPARHAA